MKFKTNDQPFDHLATGMSGQQNLQPWVNEAELVSLQ